ncbi:MAG: hypothetical protein RL199_692 [Pseudomonadota bacterium]|jgi:hypothetical protein
MERTQWRSGQRSFAETVMAGKGGAVVPTVRPTADPELEACFERAATAWARWRERRRWAGQAA